MTCRLCILSHPSHEPRSIDKTALRNQETGFGHAVLRASPRPLIFEFGRRRSVAGMTQEHIRLRGRNIMAELELKPDRTRAEEKS